MKTFAIVIGFTLLACFACSTKREGAPMPTPSSTSTTTTTKQESSWAFAPPKTGPCTTDADCKLWLEPCVCSCLPVVELPNVSNEDWSHQCGSKNPGRNCGVASPCMNKVATCDIGTKTCKVMPSR